MWSCFAFMASSFGGGDHGGGGYLGGGGCRGGDGYRGGGGYGGGGGYRGGGGYLGGEDISNELNDQNMMCCAACGRHNDPKLGFWMMGRVGGGWGKGGLEPRPARYFLSIPDPLLPPSIPPSLVAVLKRSTGPVLARQSRHAVLPVLQARVAPGVGSSVFR